ncbi:MAG: hypothetical protein ACYC4L_02345 [Chloroflexota bacterium]
MFSWLGNWIGPLGPLMVVVLLLAGCSGAVVLPNSNGAPVAAAAAVTDGPRHDLAVISLDFDPPLRVLEIGEAKPNITLLAAIDNSGTFTEKQITVVATLRSSPDDELLVQRQQVVANLAPGQASIVSFGTLPGIPARDSYALTIAVEAAPGEDNTQNNTKTLPLQLVMGR